MNRRIVNFFMVLIWSLPWAARADGVTHHLEVTAAPAAGRISVHDRLTFRQPRQSLEFRLNAGLRVSAEEGRLERVRSGPLQARYRLRLERPASEVKLRWEGRPRFAARRGHGGMPQGDVSTEGVYLDGDSAWYPLLETPLAGLDLTVRLPEGWEALSTGRRTPLAGGVRWRSERPLQDIYLVAGPYRRHERAHGEVTLAVWLLQDDPALARRYLEPMGDYIDHYSDLIGPYPYARFTVVENRWPTGLGMPGFTMLGGQVMRLPFIPYTSLPHEILHNWWGNGVWVDYARGNWSEGLTAYLADHWMQERQGRGAEYRLRALQRYSNYAARGDDLPLRRFVSRHDEASQSVGYSKSLMFFHMLRRALGDAEFRAGLQRLWREHRFRRIGFERAVRTLLAGHDELLARFLPWLDRTGAPRLRLEDARAEGDGRRLKLVLDQGVEPPFDLQVPLRITLEDGRVLRRSLHLAQRRRTWTIELPARPRRLEVDPDYDLLRLLDPLEQPPALSLLFGGDTWLVLPADAPPEDRAAWQALARAWQRRYPGLKVTDDAHADAIPAGANRLLLGWENRLFEPRRLSEPRFVLERDALLANGKRYARGEAAVVRVSTDAEGRSTGFIGAEGAELIAALARKLPHYGGYGVLAFDAASARNLLKASPPNPRSPLVRVFRFREPRVVR